MKKCNACLTVLPDSSFYPVQGKLGPYLASECKTCSCARVQVWRLTNQHRIAVHTKRQHEKLKLQRKPRIDAKKKQIAERTEKQCSVCKNVLPIELFAKDGRKLDGKDSACQQCRNTNQRNNIETFARTVLSSRASHIRSLLPQSLVEAKAAQLLLKRLIKEQGENSSRTP